jgi:hypothetical protein
MKKLLLSLIVLAGFAGVAPQAEAGHRDRYVRYYDDCHRPVYGYREVRVVRHYRPSYYCAPRVRYYDDCGPRYYRSRPRFSFNFGF